MKFIKNNKWALLVSFTLPLLLMAAALAMTGIYWGSGRSVLAGDAYHQYVAIHSLYRNILHSGGTQGFLYTFTSGLGLNLYAFSAYYMGSFFMPLTFFFNVHNMPDALYLITLLKFGFIGLSAFVSFKNMYKKLSVLMVIAVSTSFALMSFLTSQLEIIMWLDVFILLPLVIWGLHRMMDTGHRWLYFVTLLILFIQNYYFGFMVVLFLVLYFLARNLAKWSWKKAFDFVITSGLAGFSSLIMLLPMYLDLKANNSDALSVLTGTFTDNSHPLDIFAKNFVGSYDTTQFSAVPMIYIGMMPFALAILFFFTRSVQFKTKLAYLGIIVFLIASFYLQVLDLFWQGMHSPNMFLHRYAFLFSLIIVLMALESLVRWHEFKTWHVILLTTFLSVGFLATVMFGNYKYLESTPVLLTFLFGLAYFILSMSSIRNWIPSHLFVIILSIFMIIESGINSLYQIQGVQKEWNFASREYYNTQVKLLSPIAKEIQNLTGTTFARADNTTPDTANDGMKYGFNAISQFSSVRNSNSSRVMRELGFHTDDTFLNLRYPGNTLLMDSLFGVAYNINQFQPDKYGFSLVSTDKNLSALTKNRLAQSLGIFVPGGFKDAQLSTSDQTSDIIKNQTNFLSALTKTKSSIFKEFYTTSEHTADKITGYSNSVTLTRKKTSTATDVSVTYGITAPAHSQIYLAVPNISYISDSATNTMISVSSSSQGVTHSLANYYVGTNDTGRFFNLGAFSNSTPLKVTLSFPENSQVSFDTTSFWSLNTQLYTNEMNKLKAHSPQVQLIKNGAKLAYSEKEAGDIFLTIPYDKGWTAQLGGKTIRVTRAQNGFSKVHVPAGTHTLTLRFFPQGLKVGIICFISGILLFITYDHIAKKNRKSGGSKR